VRTRTCRADKGADGKRGVKQENKAHKGKQGVSIVDAEVDIGTLSFTL
jgi:hypothetical protein